MNVIKRDCEVVEFDKQKIVNAIMKAMKNGSGIIKPKIADEIADEIYNECKDMEEINIFQIEEMVFNKLIAKKQKLTAKAYEGYRSIREFQRECQNTTDDAILKLLDMCNEEAKEENSNKNPTIAPTQRDYMAGEVSKDLSKRILLPPEIIQAHEDGVIHFHDMDYFAEKIHNCDLINLGDMLYHDTVINGKSINNIKSFLVGCNVTTQITAQVASSQYGGQSISLSDLAPLVDVSRQKYRQMVREEFASINKEVTDEEINQIAESRTRTEIKNGVQIIQYQINTLMTCNGQTPFITIFMYLNELEDGQTKDDLALIIEEVLNQRIQGMQNEKGVWITPAFPKLIYVLEEDNITEDSRYWYLTELAAKCTAKRMVPDYISEKIMKEYKDGDVYTSMGCRSFLTVDRFSETKGNIAKAKNYVPGKHKYYGRFNQGVVTINLVDVACSSGKDFNKFWEILDERLELCHRALQCRHKRLLNTPSDIAPILWQHGALARLEKGELINDLLYDGYSTISLGYAGLAEMVYYMMGCYHVDSEEAKQFGLQVMQRLNDKCNEWKLAENIDYSVYGTPLESTTYKFAKCLQKRFGMIENVTDHNYITNSYHVCVREPIDAFTKLAKESEFQRLSPGG